MRAAKARARRVRVPKRAARKPVVARTPSHKRVWLKLGSSVERAVRAFENGKNPKGALKTLDVSLNQIAKMQVPKNLKPDQIHDRITHIRKSFNLRDVERRINALVVSRQISMKQRAELMRRVHKANELREKRTIRLASMSPSDAARPSFAAMGPDFLPKTVVEHTPRVLRTAYEKWNRIKWPRKKPSEAKSVSEVKGLVRSKPPRTKAA